MDEKVQVEVLLDRARLPRRPRHHGILIGIPKVNVPET